MSTPSDPFLKPERLPSWVRNLPEVATGEETEVVVAPPWPVQLVKRHARPLMAAGGALVFLLVIVAVWPSKKPVAKAVVPAAQAVAAKEIAPPVVPAVAAAVPRAAPPAARATASTRRKKAAAARPVRASKATKESPKGRRPERPAAGRG